MNTRRVSNMWLAQLTNGMINPVIRLLSHPPKPRFLLSLFQTERVTYVQSVDPGQYRGEGEEEKYF